MVLFLFQAFSTPWFLFASPTNHHLVFFLLEVFNNIIQYQFDGKYVSHYAPNSQFLQGIVVCLKNERFYFELSVQ